MADDDDDMLFSSALPVEAFGAYSGETELELEQETSSKLSTIGSLSIAPRKAQPATKL